MVLAASPSIAPGSLVAIYDKEGQPFGTGIYNDRARVPLRVITHQSEPVGEEIFDKHIDRALALRLDDLKLPSKTDAFRAINSDADALSGLMVDKYGEVLSIEVHSLGIWQRLPKWLPKLHERLGTTKVILDVDERIARMEGINLRTTPSDKVFPVKIREHGIRYEVDFEQGHKTGFFCDQRENRLKLAGFCEGRRVLDLCCYTGGFAISAKVTGKAEEVVGVDLDEKAIEQAKRNANLNQARITWAHCDAFSYARQMQRNNNKWDVVILDPPKLLMSRDEIEAEEGYRKYEDLNGLGMSILRPGGILVTCSCSGLLSQEEFERIAIKAAHRQGKRLQFLDITGAGADHPVLSNCSESRYLKVIWARVVEI